MQLEYLLFDFTDEESGCGSFDAMACVLPDRLPALVHEIEAVLRWAHQAFGAPAGPGDEGEWDFDLQGGGERDTPLDVGYDAGRGRVTLPPTGPGAVTLTLTLGGSRTFCAAFRQAFPDEH